jgi:hypothetical protein
VGQNLLRDYYMVLSSFLEITIYSFWKIEQQNRQWLVLWNICL